MNEVSIHVIVTVLRRSPTMVYVIKINSGTSVQVVYTPLPEVKEEQNRFLLAYLLTPIKVVLQTQLVWCVQSLWHQGWGEKSAQLPGF